MKFFTVFAAILSVAFAAQGSWTLNELSAALQNPSTDPALVPYLENALNEIMSAIHAGHQVEAVAVTIPSVDLSTWSLAELSEALQNPSTDAALVPYLEQALNAMMDAIVAGTPVEVAPVVIPAMDISSWTLSELTEALDNPSTNPALVPYLEHALNEMMSALISGQQIEAIAVAVPADLLEQAPAMPIAPAPVEAPVVPAPVEAPAVPAEVPSTPLAPSSPLVQIIVNINQQAVSPVVVDQTPILPEPVMIVDESAVVEVEPVQVVDTPTIIEPVQVVDTPTIIEPVQVVDTPTIVEPVQVVEVAPVVPEPVVIGTPIIPAPAVVLPEILN